MAKEFLTFRNASKSETVIEVDEAIGPYIDWEEWRLIMDNTSISLKKKLKEIPQSASHTITVNIDNNFGGFLADGIAMHDMLAEHKATVVTNIRGFCASAATILAQSGSNGKRRISANAFYLIHKGIIGIYGNANDIESALRDMHGIDQKIADLYARRSGKEASSFLELMNKNNGNGIWLSAEEALEYGLVDEVFEPNSKAVSLEKVQNFYSKEKHLPPLPTITNNSPDMNLEEFFNKLSNKIDSLRNPAPQNAGEGVQEIKILDNEEVTNMISGLQDQIKNAVSKEDHDAVVNAKNTLETEKASWATEKTDFENKIKNLESEVAKLKGTKLDPENAGGDPPPEGGPAKKTQNELNAEKNAAAFRNV